MLRAHRLMFRCSRLRTRIVREPRQKPGLIFSIHDFFQRVLCIKVTTSPVLQESPEPTQIAAPVIKDTGHADSLPAMQ